MTILKLQRELNEFFKRFKLGYKPLKVDGSFGPVTRERVKEAKFYLGYKGRPSSDLNDQFLWRLQNPRKRHRDFKVSRSDVKRGIQRRVNRRKARRARTSWDWAWGGSRGVTNEVVRIVGGRAPITSRKRTATFGNPGSDHHVSQLTADAVDFGIAEAHWLKNEISRRMGGPPMLTDFGSFTIERKGKRFRVQIIAGTHGTGPHLHVGVRRA
jgi:hypothetical protein